MGVLRLMGTLLRHPATLDALIENTPVFECLLIDYNANIHYILQKTIVELNEILYFVYKKENNDKNVSLHEIISDPSQYNLDLDFNIEELEDLLERYNEDYQIGTTFDTIQENLSNEERISDIIFIETINYTKKLICSLNKGWIKKVYLALDGTPSMAKIKEQRNRRYVGSHMNNIKEDIVKRYKLHDTKISQIDLFYYRSMICAGTKFMDKIQQALFNLNIDLDIDVSTLNIKGEGEKKIIHAMDDYSQYNSFCIMSPDSDMLILIGLLSNDPKFIGKKIYNFRIDYQRKNQYQFFDLNQLIINFQKYYSQKLGLIVSTNNMLDMFFMLVVFGNDFLPKLEPLDITQHFDFVCETCLRLSNSMHFIKENRLNYQYLLEFFKLINKDIITLAVEQYLNNKYNNFKQLCKAMTLSEKDLMKIHHTSLKPNIVNYTNYSKVSRLLSDSYQRLTNFLGCTDIARSDINNLYSDIHAIPDDSYLLLVLPRMVKFPGSDNNDDCQTFFTKFVEYIMTTRNFQNVKFRNRLMPKDYNMQNMPFQKETVSAYINEIEKLNKSMEPYRSIFRINNINLVSYDLSNNRLVDLRGKYYDTYLKPNMTQKEIGNLVTEYLVGIEWLYQYYITCKRLEWSGWHYNNSQPPLIDNIIEYLEKHPNPHDIFDKILESYPENNMGPMEHYLFVTPNEYTNAGVAPNLSDVLHLIDGNGALYLNKAQIKWHEYEKK